MISDLPDSLLIHILSFLPTVNSVTTCILSRRWRHLWEDLQAFEFDDEFYYMTKNGKGPINFVQFVNMVLILRRVHHIKKFSLSCNAINNSIGSETTAWIRGAIGPQLQELNLKLNDWIGGAMKFLLPGNIFTYTTLVSLSLQGSIRFDPRYSVHLPSLKNLEWGMLYESPTEKLLRGCPVLETLVLRSHTWVPPSKYILPLLKRFTFKDGILYNTVDTLDLHTPFLEYLDITFHSTGCCQFSASDFSKVVEAHLDIFHRVEHVNFVPELLVMLNRIRYLELKLFTTSCLLNTLQLYLPQYCKLVHLKVEVPSF